MLKYALCCSSLAFFVFVQVSSAQVVQLPTYRVFSVGTTVSVPDGGAAYLGGVTRGSWSSSSRGVPGLSQLPGANRLFTNRSIGSSVSSSNAYATATIIDHAEMDRLLLAEAAARRGEPRVISVTDRRAAYLSKFVARRPTAKPSMSLTATRDKPINREDRIADAKLQQEANMASYIERAKRAEATGHLGAARCFYNVLARRGNDEQRQAANARLATLNESSHASEKIVRREP
jgi:Bacterial type II and III secretion system protein